MKATSPTSSASWDGGAYDAVAEAQHRWGLEVITRVPASARRVLDAGCGSGRVTADLLARMPAARVTCLDASASMIEAARQRLTPFADRVSFLAADLAVPLPEDLQVDCVLSTGTLHWVTDHTAAFANLFSALAPGGALVAQCGGAGSLARVRDRLDRLGIQWRHLNCYVGAEDTEARLRACGYVDVWCWLEPRPIGFASVDALARYLDAAALSPYVEGLDPEHRSTVVAAVASAVSSLTLDFVRLNILARRPLAPGGPEESP